MSHSSRQIVRSLSVVRSAARCAAVVFAAALPCAAACQSAPDEAIPVSSAPPSRHAALRQALTDDARGLAFEEGQWLESLGDAPFFGLAWLSRRAVSGPLPGPFAA